jgi:hypothetical protein
VSVHIGRGTVKLAGQVGRACKHVAINERAEAPRDPAAM